MQPYGIASKYTKEDKRPIGTRSFSSKTCEKNCYIYLGDEIKKWKIFELYNYLFIVYKYSKYKDRKFLKK